MIYKLKVGGKTQHNHYVVIGSYPVKAVVKHRHSTEQDWYGAKGSSRWTEPKLVLDTAR
jgi:hypothetical protein